MSSAARRYGYMAIPDGSPYNPEPLRAKSPPGRDELPLVLKQRVALGQHDGTELTGGAE